MECGVYFYIDLTNMLKENEVGGSSKMGVGLFLRLRDFYCSLKNHILLCLFLSFACSYASSKWYLPLCVSPSLRCATSFHVYFIHKGGWLILSMGLL